MAPKFGSSTFACTMKGSSSWADIVDDDELERERLLAQQATLRKRLGDLKTEIASYDDKAHQAKLDERRRQTFKLHDVLLALQARYREVEASIHARLTEYLRLQQAVTLMRQTQSVPVKACSPRPAASAEDEDRRLREQLMEEQSALRKRLERVNKDISAHEHRRREHDDLMTQSRKELFESHDLLESLLGRVRDLVPSTKVLLKGYIQHQKVMTEQQTKKAKKPRRPTRAFYTPPHRRLSACS